MGTASAGTTVRVFCITKTVADCFKFRNKIGLDVAIEALQEAWRSKCASIRARGWVDFNLCHTRFTLERLLYRLSVSAWSNAFLLKGALLFDIWFDEPHRPTRDIDLLGFGPAGLDHMTTVFQAICGQFCDDGVEFEQATVCGVETRKDANYGGVRVTLSGTLDGARCAVQVMSAMVTP